MLCAKNREMYVYPLAEEPGLHPNLTRVHGHRACVNPIPRGMRKPGDFPQVCPRPKKFERLATRDTLHGSRPNLRRRDPKDRTVPPPLNVSGKGASTKRCVRKKKRGQLHVHIYKVPLREVPRGVAQERSPNIQHLTACGQKTCTCL